MDLPNRKQNRLSNFNYDTPGAYFITICVKERKPILSDIIVGANTVRPEIRLTRYGEIVKNAIINIPIHYPAISVDKYVIMPEHIHILLEIHTDISGRTMFAPTIDRVIKQMKGYISKEIGFSIWQKSFNDHIIRNQEDYNSVCEYIVNNPKKFRNNQ